MGLGWNVGHFCCGRQRTESSSIQVPSYRWQSVCLGQSSDGSSVDGNTATGTLTSCALAVATPLSLHRRCLAVGEWFEDQQESASRRATAGGDIHVLGTASSVGIMQMVTRDTGDTSPLFNVLSLVAVCRSVSSPHQGGVRESMSILTV